jgi:hypothetical protein
MPSQPENPEHRGGQAPPAEQRDRPEQNVGYDEAAKGGPLTPEEEARAEAESPLTEDEPDDDEVP